MAKLNSLLYSIVLIMTLSSSANAQENEEYISCYEVIKKIEKLERDKIDYMSDSEDTMIKTALFLAGAGLSVGDISAETNTITTEEKIKALREKLKYCSEY